jgi:ubiquinone/menaquinone biosynthesis C-methylase UbiE
MAHQHQVLDVGCGLGGSARFAASHYGCAVTGVDLTAESVATGNTLCQWVGLEDKVSLQVGDATALTLADASFDRIYMMHVGMNVADKHALIASLSHLLRPGGRLGIYDIMRTGDATQTFPVPWASIAQGSEVAPIATYQQAVKAAGLVLLAEQNRREFALKFFEKLKARASSNGGPPPLGLHIVMGERHAEKIRNLMSDISRSIVAPVELIARKGD